MTTPTRFFLDSDPDCSVVLVPVACRAKWRRWWAANNRLGFTLPPYVVRLSGDSSLMTFTDPRDPKGNPLSP